MIIFKFQTHAGKLTFVISPNLQSAIKALPKEFDAIEIERVEAIACSACYGRANDLPALIIDPEATPWLAPADLILKSPVSFGFGAEKL